MGGESWFLVGSLLILLSTAAVTRNIGVCLITGSNPSNRSITTHYYCTNNYFVVLNTEILDPNRTFIGLKNLFLASNRIQDVKHDVFRHLEKLEVLVLSENLIYSLDEDVFSKLKLLQHLDLSVNSLYELPDRLFSSQDRLKTLLLQGNKLYTISVPLLTPLRSIASLNLYRNQLRCDCEVMFALIWCENRRMDTKATCKDQVSGYDSPWTRLEFAKKCSENPFPSVLPESVPPYTKSVDRVVAVSSYVVPLCIVGAVALGLMCFGLFLLYLRRRRPPSVSTIREEGHHMTVPESKKSHLNNQQPVRSEGTSPVSYDLPEHDNPSKMAVSNCSTINRSSDASVMVENSLYSV